MADIMDLTDSKRELLEHIVECQVNLHRNPRMQLARSFSSIIFHSCRHLHVEPSEEEKRPIPDTPPGQPRKRNVFDILDLIEGARKNDDPAKNILVRVDFNVPMDQDGDDRVVTDDSRIRAAVSTIKAILDADCNAILVAHMGRPKLVQKGKDDEQTRQERHDQSLRPAAERLAEILHRHVHFAQDCIGEHAKKAVAALSKQGGEVLLLENLRFHKEETDNDQQFAKSLASYADAYVNDAFGTAHRAHASVTGVPAQLPKDMCGIGCLVASEVAYLDFHSVGKDAKIAAIIGGSKVSTKLPVIKGLLDNVDTLLLGGGLAFPFVKAKGIPVGSSLVEDDMIQTAKDLLKFAEEKGKKLILPIDAVCAKSFPKKGETNDTRTFDLKEGAGIEDGWSGYDIGPKTIDLFRESLEGSTKLVLNGPVGVFEVPPFQKGTEGIIDIMEDITKEGTVTVVGGGDSVAALESFGKSDAVSYVSTGGGATLELLSGKELPGVAAISDM